jgi:hypothetical protein
MSQEEKISNPLEGTFSQIRKSLSKNEDITDPLIELIIRTILASTNSEEEFNILVNEVVVKLIVNAAERAQSNEEAIPGNTVVGASNNIVKFSRANIPAGEVRSLEPTKS